MAIAIAATSLIVLMLVPVYIYREWRREQASIVSVVVHIQRKEVWDDTFVVRSGSLNSSSESIQTVVKYYLHTDKGKACVTNSIFDRVFDGGYYLVDAILDEGRFDILKVVDDANEKDAGKFKCQCGEWLDAEALEWRTCAKCSRSLPGLPVETGRVAKH